MENKANVNLTRFDIVAHSLSNLSHLWSFTVAVAWNLNIASPVECLNTIDHQSNTLLYVTGIKCMMFSALREQLTYIWAYHKPQGTEEETSF